MTSSQQGRGVHSGRLLDSYLDADSNLPSTSRHGGQAVSMSEDKHRPLILNSNSCLSLKRITESFSGPIKEEHAWAIIYECCKCLEKLLVTVTQGRHKPGKVYLVTCLSELFLHRDGRIHESTFISPKTPTGKLRTAASSEDKVLGELSIVIYMALDHGLVEAEERKLSEELGNLLELMQSNDDENEDNGTTEDDEGIEQDHEEDEQHFVKPEMLIQSVIETCARHLSVSSEAELHYRNVCRALISEALEFSSFLERTQVPDIFDNELSNLERQEWKQLWDQAMGDLRNGVKLKKTDFTKTPIEFALTPYEMLMDDIRSRRYKLKQVMVDGKLPPKVKKDAHDAILDFIRSRPPLKPASLRVLPPPRVDTTPQELLMEEIRSGHTLKKTLGPPQPKNTPVVWDDIDENESNDESLNPNSNQPKNSPCPVVRKLEPSPNPSHYSRPAYIDSTTRRRTVNYKAGNPVRLFGTGNPVRRMGNGVVRSQSLIVRPKSMSSISTLTAERRQIIPDRSYTFDPDSESDDDNEANASPNNNLSKDDIATFSTPTSASPHSSMNKLKSVSTFNLSHNSNHLSITSSSHHLATSPPYNSNCPSRKTSPEMSQLTQEEVAHIRNALSKAKMEENMSSNGSVISDDLRKDMESGKVCYQCTKVRFTFWTWSKKYQCRLCQHVFCESCIEKTRIRSDFFTKIPILALTPQSASQNSKNRTKSVPAFSAMQSVGDNTCHSAYVPTLSDHVENGFSRLSSETPKRVSFSVITSPPEDSAKGKAVQKSRLRRSNTTVGKVDTHAQAQAQRRPLSDNRSANLPVSPSIFQSTFFTNKSSNNSNVKTEEVHVCRDCKEVAERDELSQQQQQQQMFSDEDEDQSDEEMSQHFFEEQQQPQQQDHVERRERRLRLTRSLIFE